MHYKLQAWDLSELKPVYLDDDLAILENQVKSLEDRRPLLTSTIPQQAFFTFLKDCEELKRKSDTLAYYYYLKVSENNLDQKSLALNTKIETFLTQLGNRLLFFNLWFKDLSEDKAHELIAASGPYCYYLERMRALKPYTLSEKEEKIINLKDNTGIGSLNSVYSVLTSKFEYLYHGKKRTQEELLLYVRHKSPHIRKEAYTLLLTTYKNNCEVIGEIYKSIVLDWRTENMTLRGYRTPIQVRNIGNDLPDEAVETLLLVCEKNETLFHRFFKLKQQKLKLKTFTRFDLYAPLGEEKNNITYDKAVDLILDSFRQFSSQFEQNAKHILDQNHIHSLSTKGKRSGAFCAAPNTRIAPFVLLTYKGNPRSVSTLAHELGHGVHFLLSSKQTEFTNGACLPLAETASIFSEMLLSETLLKQDPKQAETLLFDKLDDLYASIIRQAGFVRFEQKAHQMLHDGKTTDEISQLYLADLKKQLGPHVKVHTLYAYEWCYIPHIFHTPFYCYAYAFGNLLTLALYEMYKEKGPAFADNVIAMLQKGSSMSPLEITKAIGIDICSEAFWQKGFDVIKEMVERLENLNH